MSPNFPAASAWQMTLLSLSWVANTSCLNSEDDRFMWYCFNDSPEISVAKLRQPHSKQEEQQIWELPYLYYSSAVTKHGFPIPAFGAISSWIDILLYSLWFLIWCEVFMVFLWGPMPHWIQFLWGFSACMNSRLMFSFFWVSCPFYMWKYIKLKANSGLFLDQRALRKGVSIQSGLLARPRRLCAQPVSNRFSSWLPSICHLTGHHSRHVNKVKLSWPL